MCFSAFSQAKGSRAPIATSNDSLKNSSEIKPQFQTDSSSLHQLRIGFDLGRLVFNQLFPSRQGYEIKVDYNWSPTTYLAAEGGWGSGKIDNDILVYKTTGQFLRLGFNKALLGVLSESDFDNAYIGLRYGTAFGKRAEAHFFVPSPFGGSTEGTAPAESYWVHWGELNAGISVGLFKNIYAGWMIRGKFLFNPGTFEELRPNYIPGYGKGDKNTVFDFNFYISYGFQWRSR